MLRAGAIGLLLFLGVAQGAGAVGADDDAPPPPSPTTLVCAEGTVWDVKRAACVAIEQSRLPERPDDLVPTVRELAYAGRLRDALSLLARAADQDDTRVLTYLGYVTRKMGDMDGGLVFYHRALAADPENHLARAYLGLAYLQIGRPDQARDQLARIRAAGGIGGWPEQALARAIGGGAPTAHDY